MTHLHSESKLELKDMELDEPDDLEESEELEPSGEELARPFDTFDTELKKLRVVLTKVQKRLTDGSMAVELEPELGKLLEAFLAELDPYMPTSRINNFNETKQLVEIFRGSAWVNFINKLNRVDLELAAYLVQSRKILFGTFERVNTPGNSRTLSDTRSY